MESKIDLPQGFEMVNSTNPEDTQTIIDLCCHTWGEETRPFIEAVIRKHPRMAKEDQFMIIDKTLNKTCSCLLLLPDVWSLEGVQIPISHMEFVSTHPEYQGKGFIHQLNTRFNERSDELGSIIQVVSGLPYFYRLLGYEYAAEAYGGFTIIRELIPNLADGQEEPVRIRPVSHNEFGEYVEYRGKVFDGVLSRMLHLEDYDYLCFSEEPVAESIVFYLVEKNDNIVGMFWLRESNGCLEMDDLYLEEASHLNTVLRFAKGFINNLKPIPLVIRPAVQEVVDFLLEHVGGSKFQRKQAWYVRIPDFSRFMLHILPLLTVRLSHSMYNQYSGHLRISTYQEAFQLNIEHGHITSFDSIDISVSREWRCDLYITPEAAPQLVLGYMTVDELEKYDNHIRVRSSRRKLIRILFPKVRARGLWSP